MSRPIRPIYFLVYGQEARRIFKELTLRIEQRHPELAALHYGVVFKGGCDPELPEGGDVGDSFFESDDRENIEVIEGNDLDALSTASSKARDWLSSPDKLDAARVKWQGRVIESSSIVILMVDNARGGCPAWAKVCEQVRKRWEGLETGLQHSFSMLLGPRLQQAFSGETEENEAFQYTAEAYLQLVNGYRNPDTQKTWLPPLVALDGRLEGGGSAASGEGLLHNLVDLLYELVALTLTNPGEINAAVYQRALCRTAGLVTIGFPIDNILSEHRYEWLVAYSTGLHPDESHDEGGGSGEDEAVDWLRDSLLGKGEEELAKDLTEYRFTPSGKKSGSRLIVEARQKVDSEFEKMDSVRTHVEQNSIQFEKDVEALLSDSVGSWLDDGRFTGEVIRILKMIRGERLEGLAGRVEKVNDLRSKKLPKVRKLEEFRPGYKPLRVARYKKFAKKLVNDPDNKSLFPDSETVPGSLQARIERVVRDAETVPGESEGEKFGRRIFNKSRRELVELESEVKEKSDQLAVFTKVELDISPLAEELKGAIAEAGGNEVYFLARVRWNDTQTLAILEEVEVFAQGNEGMVPAVFDFDGEKTWNLSIHNHPSGHLAPSEADIDCSGALGAHKIGSAIINNEASEHYLIIKPFPPREELLPEIAAEVTELEADVGRLEGKIRNLYRKVRKLEEEWGFITTIPGWSGCATVKTLRESGDDVKVASYDDERAAHVALNECRRDLRNKVRDLEREPERKVGDGDVPRVKALNEEIEVLKEKKARLEVEWLAGNASIQKWETKLVLEGERLNRVGSIKQSLEDQLCISEGCARQDEDYIRGITVKLKRADKDLSDFRRNWFRLGGGGIFLLAVIFYFLLSSFFPGTQAEIKSTRSGPYTIQPGRERVSFEVHGRAYSFADIGVQEWDVQDLVEFLNIKFGNKKKICKDDGGFLVIFDEIAGSDSSVSIRGSGNTYAYGELGLTAGEEVRGGGLYSTRVFWWALAVLVLCASAGAILLHYFSENRRRKRDLLKEKKKELKRDLDQWEELSLLLFQEAYADRVRLEALEGAIAAINTSLSIVEHIQRDFEGFVESVLKSRQDAESGFVAVGALPRSRAFYSVVDREQLDRLILTAEIRREDARRLEKFKLDWKRSRLWKEFLEDATLGDWESDLNSRADETYQIIKDFNLEYTLNAHTEIMEPGGGELQYLTESLKPMAALNRSIQGDERVNYFASCKIDANDFGALGDRLNHFGSGTWKYHKSGSPSIASLLVHRSNILGRRIAFLQSGIQGLLERPWQEMGAALSGAGSDLDIFFNSTDCSVLQKLSDGKRIWRQNIVKLLPALICSDAFSFDKKTKEFQIKTSEVKLPLGRSVGEILFRLEGVGLSDAETKALGSVKKKALLDGVDERFIEKYKPFDRLFSRDLRVVDKKLCEVWDKVKAEVLKKFGGDDPPGAEAFAAPEPTPQDPGAVDSAEPEPDPDIEAEPDSEPEVPEVPEADSELPGTEDPDPESGPGQEQDSEADIDTGDDPAPEDTPDGDSE